MAASGGELIIRPDELLSIRTDCKNAVGHFTVGHLDYVDEGPPIHMISEYSSLSPDVLNTFPIWTDNSLEARILRQDRPEMVPVWIDDEGDE
jgi:hypothetical protein